MSIDSTWLRCPNCLLDLTQIDVRVYGCAAGHRFDRAKHGYLTLLAPRAPRTIGDDREMLAARATLLEGGAYAPIGAALVDAVQATLPTGARSPLRIADFGCGTGYYSAVLARALPEAAFLLADRSPDAVRTSLRAHPDATGVVLDIWRPLPVRDAVVDVALNVFAPRNGPEFARVLRPNGRLVVIVPTDAHLHELRAEGALLDVPTGKADRVAEQLAVAGLGTRSTVPVEYTIEADASTRALLAGMGPSAHHAAELSPTGTTDGARTVTVSVELVVFERASVVS
ncbi:putative RNA methyltransferase [Agromyces ramosus]|uniref:23S rRNA (Guanine745-N1)-methyltransferase n=1 Tax=Agromyces ramosus TaxID=33879 RepID=A0ABU0RG54_9MICO|nr:methyltransferase domain-containing protein [Agromyces ramosus]MDQ0896019.1 23S rRNA (guanine745-N1)-methyltransferase [Agromyces ramosus]